MSTVGVALGSVAAGVGAVPLAMTLGLYGVAVVAVVVGAVLGWPWLAKMVPPVPRVADVLGTVQPMLRWRAPRWTRGRWPILPLAGFVGVIAFFGASMGMKGVAGLAVLAIGAAAVPWAVPALRLLSRAEPVDGSESVRSGSSKLVLRAGIRITAIVTVLGAAAAFLAAQMGLKGLLIVAGTAVLGTSLAVVRDRSTLLLFGAMGSLVLLLHKSFGPIDDQLSGGAISMYVSTFDVMIVILWILWLREGTIRRDLRAARTRVLNVPLIGLVLLLPSLLMSRNITLSLNEYVRMGWMYLLFVYVAVRVRTRRQIVAALMGLGCVACVEVLVVVLQWKTGGVLGLDFLGVPTSLGERVTDRGSLGRPFGTIIHPVFMGAFMGALGLLFLGLGLRLSRSWSKLACLGLTAVCVLPLYLSHTRAAFVAFAMAGAVIVLVSVRTGHVSRAALHRGMAVLFVCGVVFWPQISAKINENFGTDHYNEEIEARLELNRVGFDMWDDNLLLGVGLNNFEHVMAPYQQYGLIFFDNPVHNLYLLYGAETGIVGFAGLAVIGLTLYAAALRLARSRDALYGGLGLGISAVMAFFMIEEILGFSLRQDVPLALFWILSGLAVSALRQDGIVFMPSLPPLPRHSRRVHAVRRVPSGPFVPDRHRHRGFPAPASAMTHTPIASHNGTAAFAPRAPVRSTRAARQPDLVRRARVGLLCVIVMSIVVSVVAFPRRARAQPASTRTEDLRVVFAGLDRASGETAVFVFEGGKIRRITVADGRTYNWPHWALGGSKIVYSVRRGSPGSPENIEIMNPDGTGRQVIAEFPFQVGQPKVAADGKSVLFAGLSPSFREVALYSLSLDTLGIRNLSAVGHPVAATDADARYTPDGESLVFSENSGKKAAISTMRADGTKRRVLLDDGTYNTDPDISPDGALLATASFRNGGDPRVSGAINSAQVRVDGWHIVVVDLRSGRKSIITKGISCVARTPDRPCAPEEASAFKPRWTPSGDRIGYETTLDGSASCVCVIDADGTDAAPVIVSRDVSILWFDWTDQRPPPGATPKPLTLGSPDKSRLLITAQDKDGKARLLDAGSDLIRSVPVDLKGYKPVQARWSPDRKRIVFVARVPVPATPRAPHPPAPAGKSRREHFVLEELDAVTRTKAQERGVAHPKVAELQVFLRESNGSIRQLTDPWIEDWEDALNDGDRRGNTQASFSADGSAIVFTNISERTGESFVLRLDLATGAVVNLSSASAGAMPVDDEYPAVDPTGKNLAFSWTHGSSKTIATLGAIDGLNFRKGADDDWFDTSPAYSPDGSALVFASYRRGTQAELADSLGKGEAMLRPGWVLVRRDISTGKETLLTTTSDAPALDPVWSPDGSRIAFISRGASSLDVFVVGARGGPVRPLQPTPYLNELHVDWR